MRFLLAGLFMLGALALVGNTVEAGKGDKKEVTLKGTITCAKCDLGVEDTCATVIVVKKDKKDVVYYLDAKSGKANHGQICTTPKPGSVVGTVSKEGKKNIVTASKVTFE